MPGPGSAGASPVSADRRESPEKWEHDLGQEALENEENSFLPLGRGYLTSWVEGRYTTTASCAAVQPPRARLLPCSLQTPLLWR